MPRSKIGKADWLTPYVSVHQDNIVAFLDAIDEHYGSMRCYLTDSAGIYLEADLDIHANSTFWTIDR